ncbi:hypothetical protein Tsubulata_049926 [Turnera subulata]|uniref:Uncharacterized protein n=1 Tax=Turnera subulata TaxID=218843 RepID=A0A9Q0GL92_9ROSI|nr:hypothetical protein Tsubulata_049926 [Turnera subulata]
MVLSAVATLTRFSATTTTTTSSLAFLNRSRLRAKTIPHTTSLNPPPLQHPILLLLLLRSSRTMASSAPTDAAATTAAKRDKITAPYGSWKSPITADVVSGASKRLGGTAVDGRGRLFWLESRPSESGRSVLVREAEKSGDEHADITPKDFAVRTTAQEYGGGAFTISGETVVFSNYKDQRLYKQSVNSTDSNPVPLTPDYGGLVVTYADGVFDSRFNRFITVMEDRRISSTNATTTIVAVNLDHKVIEEPKVLVSGNDFYAFPRVDPRGERIVWIEWGHPNMPWDKTELWVGYISENGDVHKRVCVAGLDPAFVESPTEPKWSSDASGSRMDYRLDICIQAVPAETFIS